jgi:hypothetical protein
VRTHEHATGNRRNPQASESALVHYALARSGGCFKIEGMTNRSRPTQAKRVREKALQEKRQQKAAKRQDAKERRDDRPMTDGEDPDLAGIVPGPQPHPYLDPDEEL